MKLQTDIEFFKEEKDEFICSPIYEVNESLNEQVKTSTENEIMVARYTQELREVRQELIKQMESERATRNAVVIGVKGMKGDQVLWNFKEKKRAFAGIHLGGLRFSAGQ